MQDAGEELDTFMWELAKFFCLYTLRTNSHSSQ